MQNNSNDKSSENNYRLPENTTLQHVTKLSIVEDKPIMMDYWTSSIEKESLIGVKETQEKLQVSMNVHSVVFAIIRHSTADAYDYSADY